MKTFDRQRPVTDGELRAALAHLVIAVMALGLSRQDVKRATLQPALDRARRALRENGQMEATR